MHTFTCTIGSPLLTRFTYTGEECASSLMHYTLMHYTLMHYTLMHYTLMHYTLMHYTLMRHPQGSRLPEYAPDPHRRPPTCRR
jgi:hypothetical protein